MDLYYTVKKSDVSIKQILKNEFNMSERFILKLKSSKCIFVNGSCVPIFFEVHPGDVLSIHENFVEDSSNVVPNASVSLCILYEDDFLLIVDKPAGLSVHPSILHYNDSLSNGVKFYFDKIGLRKRIRPVNRLDKDTSGIVIFAKNEYIQECLVKQMSTNCFQKKYIAVLDGVLERDFGTIVAPITRKNGSIIERCVDDNGDYAVSHFRVLSRFNGMTEVEFVLETGRTHQLRVHSKFIGHPIVGDTLYGTFSNLISRQALHSYYVKFIHPITKETTEIRSDLPMDIKNILTNSHIV